LEKRERGRIQGLSNFWVLPIISGTGKATDFKFCRNIHRIDRNKSHLKVGNSGRGRSQGVPKIFRALICRAHCAVIFAMAQLCCPLSLRVSEILPLMISRTPLFPYPSSSLPKISPCSPGSRWIAFWLQRAKVLG